MEDPISSAEEEVKVAPKRKVRDYDADTEVDHRATPARPDQGRCIRRLEGELAAVRDSVGDIHSKLDSVMEALSQRAQEPPLTVGMPSPHLDDTPPHRPKSARRHTETKQDFIDRHLEREAFQAPRTDGKAAFINDIYVNNMIAKPYMYVNKPSCPTLKKKLEARSKLTMVEYCYGLVSLMRDPRAGVEGIIDKLTLHLQQELADAQKRPWPQVMAWSQHVFDAIEKEEYTWHDDTQIHMDRVVMSLTGPAYVDTDNNGRSGGTQAERESGKVERDLPCRDYNSHRGCRHRSDHVEGKLKLLHACAYCMRSVRESYPHPTVRCERRDRHMAEGNGGQNTTSDYNNHNGQGYSSQYAQRTGNQYQNNAYTFPKNG